MSNPMSQITNMQNRTSEMESKKEKQTGVEQEYDQDMFLKLMMEQLKYQDPLNPTGSDNFLQQQAMFTQVSELQKLNSAIASNNSIMQGSLLIDKEVTIQDPNNAKEEITGIVTSVSYEGNELQIEINGKFYPSSYIKNVASINFVYVPEDNTGTGNENTNDQNSDNTENNNQDKTEIEAK